MNIMHIENIKKRYWKIQNQGITRLLHCRITLECSVNHKKYTTHSERNI